MTPSAAPASYDLPISALDRLTDDSVAITFAVPDDLRELFAFEAGQHVTLVGDDEVRRSYSLCVPPSSGLVRIGVKQIPGGAFSQGVLPRLSVGDSLRVMRPTGTFGPQIDPATSRRLVAVAAGSGITPVLSIVGAVLAEEAGSEAVLVVVNRTQRSVMFADEIADLKDRYPSRVQLLHVLTREQQDVELLSGRLDADRFRALLPLIGPVEGVDDWFLCGPQPLVVQLRDLLRDLGAHRVHTELFHAEPVPRAAVRELGGEDGAAHVTVHLEGRSSDLRLRPDGPPVLEAALAVRPELPFACRGGVCGTCRAKVLQGSVAMDANWALEPEEIEAGYVLTCQSHPTSQRLVVDYDA